MEILKFLLGLLKINVGATDSTLTLEVNILSLTQAQNVNPEIIGQIEAQLNDEFGAERVSFSCDPTQPTGIWVLQAPDLPESADEIIAIIQAAGINCSNKGVEVETN